ncbi:glycoside hydrolase family 65 protein [Proteus mirabilis]|uniref:glycoside hydrolase family 65 protein n=1 Tax=Proteus mirabilis TaxID=584 RepID=UPI001A1FD9B2|nr:glycosyl hydrolase family 65 protein [Proteus mirabilis]MCT8226978.1 glycoside hydrolase family 65 protein [Proteus mirabilis]HAT4483002.1 glycoside hydrolase family 65 protein [Proteus mirabilis]
MNYISVILSDTDITIKYLSEKSHYSFNTTNSHYLDWLNMAKAINHKFKSAQGGLIYSTSNKSDSAIIKTIDNKVINLSNFFTEIFNKPFIYINKAQLEHHHDLEEKMVTVANNFAWSIEYSGLETGKDEYCQESLLTTANGYIGLRGTLPEMTISDEHYPATYIAGLYNQASSQIENHQVINEDFVNAPNGQFISLKIGKGEYLHPKQLITHHLTRHLDLKTGVFTSQWRVETPEGQQLDIHCTKFANMADMSHYAILYTFKPLNFSGEITVITRLEGNTYNYGVQRYRSLNPHHYHVLQTGANKQHAFILAQTDQSKIGIGLSSTIRGDFFANEDIVCHVSDTLVEQTITFNAQQNTTYQLEKCVAVTTSTAYPDSWQNVINWEQQPLHSQLINSQKAWKTLWDSADISISGDLMTQKLLRLHTFHLLSSASPFSNQQHQLDVSVTARGLHGEAYRGHIFWDEIFILPFYIMHFPETARQLLLYRYHRLPAARLAARAEGFQGAMFPWQSGHDGSEQTQTLHLNPLSGQWDADHSCRQRHVSLAIAYNVWLYWLNTHDHQFMEQYGLELLNDITLFWLDQCQWDEGDQRFHINGVMGPDEFHEKYADSLEGGLKDNAYTNLMVVWLFNQIEMFINNDRFSKKLQQLNSQSSVFNKIQEVKNRIAINIDAHEIIEQFSGYFQLKDLDWESYRKKYGNIYRMDRILRKENKSADDYKVAKQADTLMLFNNLDKQTVHSLITSLGYSVSKHFAEKNLHYYLERTSHGSTLSRIVHAYLAEQIQLHDLSWQLYQDALYSDYNDIQGGTTAEGIHTGVMAATLNTTIMAYAGVDIRQDMLTITPSLPQQWQKLSFKLLHRSTLYQINLTHKEISILSDKPSTILINHQTHKLTANTLLVLNLNGDTQND